MRRLNYIDKIYKMATLQCRVQYLDDIDPFNSTNFPEPTRPPTYTFLISVPLCNQISGVKRLLKAPHKVSSFYAVSRRKVSGTSIDYFQLPEKMHFLCIWCVLWSDTMLV